MKLFVCVSHIVNFFFFWYALVLPLYGVYISNHAGINEMQNLRLGAEMKILQDPKGRREIKSITQNISGYWKKYTTAPYGQGDNGRCQSPLACC